MCYDDARNDRPWHAVAESGILIYIYLTKAHEIPNDCRSDIFRPIV